MPVYSDQYIYAYMYLHLYIPILPQIIMQSLTSQLSTCYFKPFLCYVQFKVSGHAPTPIHPPRRYAARRAATGSVATHAMPPIDNRLL